MPTTTRGGRSPARSRPRSAASRARTPAARPAKRARGSRSPRPGRPPLLVVLIRAVYRLLRAIWVGIARGLASSVRAVGSGARELKVEPAQRRDGAALAVLAVSLIIGAAVWWSAGGPAGQLLGRLLRSAIGVGAAWLPPLLAFLAWRLVRKPADPAARGRLTVGWAAIALGILGLVHIAHGVPDSTSGARAMRRAGGAVGYLASSPLSSGLTAYVAAPLLALLAIFGVCVLTKIPLAELPHRLLTVGEAAARRLPWTGGNGEPGEPGADRPEEKIDLTGDVPVKRGRSARSRVGVFAAADRDQPEPSHAPVTIHDEVYDLDTDDSPGLAAAAAERATASTAPTVATVATARDPSPQDPAPVPKKAEQLPLPGSGDYRLPPPELLREGTPAKARVERGVGVLKDHVHAPSQLGPGAGGGQVGALEQHAAGAGRVEPDREPRHGRFAAAALADQGERGALGDGERHLVHGAERLPGLARHHPLQPRAGHVEQAGDVVGLKHRLGGVGVRHEREPVTYSQHAASVATGRHQAGTLDPAAVSNTFGQRGL